VAKINKHTQPTIDAVYRSYVEARKEEHRAHLGASVIGEECHRKLWYLFHWCGDPTAPGFDGRMLRLFDYGWRAEERFVAELRAAGVRVLDVDPATGKQWTFSALGGHFGCSLDGAGVGFLERPTHWHVVEFKTSNDKNFRRLASNGVQKAQPKHYAQMQIGMEFSGMDRAFYLAENKNDSSLYSERVRHDPAEAQRLLDVAEKVIFSEEPLAGVSDDPSYYQCKWCDFANVCHRSIAPEVSCRNCAHATAERDGTWSCARHDRALSVADQRAACDDHLYHPSIVGQPVEGGSEDGIEYAGPKGQWRNGRRDERSYTSRELAGTSFQAVPLGDPMESMRMEMDGELQP
jgi:hypothetical protein